MDKVFLYGAENPEQERDAAEILRVIHDRLLEIGRGSHPDIIVTDYGSSMLFAWMMDIGSAPDMHPASGFIRQSAAMQGMAAVHLEPEAATSMASKIKTGMIRHQAGVSDPSTFIIH